MFWQSVIGGLSVLAHWQVWVALAIYSALQFVWLISIGMLIAKSESGVRMSAGCITHMIAGSVFQSILIGGLVLFLTPIMLDGDQAMPFEFFASFAWPIVKTCLIALVLSFILSTIPIVGGFCKTPGLDTFIQGIIIFRIFSAVFIERLLEESNAHASNLYPGFWSGFGYFVLTAVLVHVCLFAFAALGATITRNRSAGEERPLVLVETLGLVLMQFLGLLPIFMYANHVSLAIQQISK